MTRLVLIGGLAAAGKSTLGREIARLTRFAFLDKDTLTRPLVEALLSGLDAPGGNYDRQSAVYLNRVRPYEYACFIDAIAENVALGVSTIAVAPFLREMADQDWLNKLQNRLPDATIHNIWIDIPETVLHQRMTDRGSARDRQKLDDWSAYIAASRSIRPCECCLVIGPDAGEDAKALALRVLNMLDVQK